MYHAKVWLNGERLGEHVDGYLPFAFDVTGKLRSSDNHLVLRVDNRPRIEWPPAAKQIEWVQYGGILQPVRVESKASVSISDLAIRAVPDGDGASVACTVEVVEPRGRPGISSCVWPCPATSRRRERCPSRLARVRPLATS